MITKDWTIMGWIKCSQPLRYDLLICLKESKRLLEGSNPSQGTFLVNQYRKLTNWIPVFFIAHLRIQGYK